MLVLNGLRHVGPITVDRLMEAFGGDAVEILRAGKKSLLAVEGVGPRMAGALSGWRRHFDLKGERDLLERNGASFVIRGDPGYPPLLGRIDDPPVGLYRKGEPVPGSRCIAIVGTRKPTLYGLKLAGVFAGRLARAGFCIVSGLARGIDAAAHVGALDAGGSTVAVLGCGLDIVYPPEHADLHERIACEGAVFSEFPFGRRADRQTFPMRNRLVSGMCEAVVVVESAASGGSMITARLAGEQGRQVLALPGRVDQVSSAGCHQLIREGATLVTGAHEILEELGGVGQGMLDLQLEVEGESRRVDRQLSGGEDAAYGVLDAGELLRLEEVAGRAGMPVQEAASALMMLELKRLVGKRADGRFERRL